MAHRGLLPSHLSFLFRHIIHANRFGLGTSALFGGYVVLLVPSCPCERTVTLSPSSPVPFMTISASGEEDMVPSRTVEGLQVEGYARMFRWQGWFENFGQNRSSGMSREMVRVGVAESLPLRVEFVGLFVMLARTKHKDAAWPHLKEMLRQDFEGCRRTYERAVMIE